MVGKFLSIILYSSKIPFQNLKNQSNPINPSLDFDFYDSLIAVIKGCKFLIIILNFNIMIQDIRDTHKNIEIEVLLMPSQTN